MTADTKWSYILFGLGFTLVAVGVTLGATWPVIFSTFLHNKLQLTNGSATYGLWIKTPIPMYLELYLFNWTNAEEFQKNQSVRPHFDEVGPFVFLEVHERKNVVWHSNGTVSYNQTRTWTFQPDLSEDITVNITNLNVIATTVAYMSRYDGWWKQLAIEMLMRLETLTVTRPAEEWLFEGMNDTLLNVLHTLKNISLPFDKFGFFYQRNESAWYDGRFTIDTGVKDLDNLGELQTWNGMEQTSYFDGKCGRVRGSTGELVGPTQRKAHLPIFITDICRPVDLVIDEDVTVDGLRGSKYVGDMAVFDNGTLWPEYKCYCRPGDECLDRGVVNISLCRWGSPLYASYPHFYLADDSYITAVSGMRPNKTEHQFYVVVEPTTGTPLEVRAQLQINVWLQPIKWLALFKKVPRVMVPMLWFRERARLTDDLASMTGVVLLVRVAGVALFYSVAGVGVVMILARLAVLLMRRRAAHTQVQPDREVLISNDATDTSSALPNSN